MATTNFYQVDVVDEKIIPFLGYKEYGPRKNVIMSQNDLASLRNAGWTIVNIRPLPETGKIKYDRRSTYFKVEGEEGKFINIPFYINPIDAREIVGLLKFDLVKLSDNSVVKTYTAKDIKSEILSIPTSDLEIGGDYKVRLYFPKDSREKYDIINSLGHEDLFERVYDEIFIKVKEYGKFTGRLVQLQQDITVKKESVLPLDKILGFKDFDSGKIEAVSKENLVQLLKVNISNPAFAKYEKEKNRLFFFSNEGKFQVKVFENGIQDNIVNFNIRVVSDETVESDREHKITYPLYDTKKGEFVETTEKQSSVDPTPDKDKSEPTSPKPSKAEGPETTVPTGNSENPKESTGVEGSTNDSRETTGNTSSGS